MFKVPSELSTHLRRGGTLLVPARQRVRAVQLAYAAAQLAAGERVWSSPDVLTPSGWARRECQRRAELSPGQWPRILGSTEEWLLWRQAAEEAVRGEAFLDAGPLADALQRASELSVAYGVPSGAAPGSEAVLLRSAQAHFEARCRAVNAASVTALTPRLLEGGTSAPLLVRGFDALAPRLAALATAHAPRAAAPPLGAAAVPRAVRTQDAQSQMEAIAGWCRERLSAQPEARLLVMLPGPAGGRERLAALIRDGLDPGAAFAGSSARTLVGIEGGEPFGSLALPAQALLSLALLAGAELDTEAISRWLTAPFWGSLAAAPRASLALLVRERATVSLNLREFLGALQLVPRELQPAARELDALLRQAVQRLGEDSASPRRWAERVEAALATLGWPGALPADSAVHQTRLRWRELLEEFGELAGSLERLERQVALELLQALALRTAYRPADEDVAVMISPVLADPVVTYDGIWVGSLSADALPQPVAPDPFLAHRAQIAAGVPQATLAGRRAQAQTLFSAWRAGTAELVLSVPRRDQDLELLPSPYLTGLTLCEEAPASQWLPPRLHREGCTERLEDATGTTFNPRAPLPAGTRALTLQNDCAFRAYAELRLGATRPETAEPGVAPDQRGLLLHAALQMLWERLRDSQALGALDDSALDALIGECVRQAARTLQVEARGRRRRARSMPDGQFELFSVLSPALVRECRRAQGLIRRLCELERARAPFAVEATEHMTELALGGGRVRMRLDRIDRVSDGRIVLDYKSGRPGSSDWYGDRPTHPQLLAYLTALGRDVVALATVNLTAREVRFTGVAAHSRMLPRVKAPAATTAGEGAGDWSAWQRSWGDLIERLIRAFLAGEARVDPAPGACDYCHVTDICRIGAHQGPEGPTHADDADE